MRILIANPFGIGDVLFSLPLVQAVRRAHPQGFLGYLCNRRTVELVEAWPELDWHCVFEKDEFRAAWRRSKREGVEFLRRTVGSVQGQRFDLLLDLSLGWHYGLAAWLGGVPKRIGFDYRGRGRFLTDRVPLVGFDRRSVAEYYLDLADRLGIARPPRAEVRLPLSEPAREAGRRYLETLGIREGKRWVGIVPGGGASWGPNAHYKQWPAERFARLGDWIASRFDAQILLIGDRTDAALCDEIARSMSAPAKQAIQLPSLLLLATVLQRCDLVVGNDSGPLHIAAAVGARSVTLFGPVDPSVYGPAGDRTLHRVVARGLACQPCYRNFHLPPCPWEIACLNGLEPEQVMEAVEETLKTT